MEVLPVLASSNPSARKPSTLSHKTKLLAQLPYQSTWSEFDRIATFGKSRSTFAAFCRATVAFLYLQLFMVFMMRASLLSRHRHGPPPKAAIASEDCALKASRAPRPSF
jgi:hypothetical protein